MSLLSGIKFIPREERKDLDKRNDYEKESKSRSKSKSKKRRKSYDYSSDEEDASADNIDLSTETSDFSPNKRMSWMNSSEHKEASLQRPNHNASSTSMAISGEAIVDNRNKFKSLLSSLKPERSTSSNDIKEVQESFTEPTGTSTFHSSTAVTDNQSVAVLLRSKLKAMKGALQAPEISSGSSKVLNRHLVRPSTVTTGESSLKSLVTAERYGGDDMDENLRRNILRMGDKFSTKSLGTTGSRAGMDEDEDTGIDMRLYQKQANPSMFNRGQVMKAVMEDEKLKKTTKHCNCCIDGSRYQELSNYTIAFAEHTYLRLKPGSLRLHPLHCEIVPFQHIASIRQCQEEVIVEVNRFKSCLRRLCEASKLSIIFTESAVQFSKMPHGSIDCIPVENQQEVVASFRDAFLSAGEEFSQHRKLIDLRSDRQLHRAVPDHFEYFCAEWGDFDDRSYGGLVHPLEGSSATHDRYFCLDVVGGILDEDPMRMKVKLPVDLHNEPNYIDNFRKLWNRYDWTKYIDQSESAEGN
jgi:hypothetical protein